MRLAALPLPLLLFAGTAFAQPFAGFEMHMGVTSGLACDRVFALFENDRLDGAISPDGRIMSTYVHGAFASTQLRSALLRMLKTRSDGRAYALL